MSRFNTIFTASIILPLMLLTPVYAGFLVDHTSTDLSEIPKQWITAAKSDLHVIYHHTSHGSQLISGMQALESYPPFGDRYAWSNTSTGDMDSLSLDDRAFEGNPPDLSQGDRDNDGNSIADWADLTDSILEKDSNSHINVVMWSWCNIGGHDITLYINSMEWLIERYGEGGSHSRAADHPVAFVFMTGHANGGGEGDSSDRANQLIREHCQAKDRILFDFADIENYDPDGNYFLDRRVDDALYYDNTSPYDSGDRGANWASEYLDRHSTGELNDLTSICGSCSHSPEGNETQDARLNCVLKGRAAWNLFARLAGWNQSNNKPSPGPGDTPGGTGNENAGRHSSGINLLLTTISGEQK